jgi:shikimate dehydrogenase
MCKKYGLVGKNISYSFSKKYFTDKFLSEKIENTTYENFDLENIFEFKKTLQNNPELKGLNITIPYKEAIIPFLDKISKKAKTIGAINTLKITKKGKLKGYNTDYHGFSESLKPLLQTHHKKALILGTGGASKAVAFALLNLGIKYKYVSRKPNNKTLLYSDLNETHFLENQIIINCTPLGTSPNVNVCPEIPYQYFTKKHIAFDLIYNPAETLFLQNAALNGSIIQNGLLMLQLQAEKSWQIWNK